MFTGFSDATIDFLWELRFHNERPWFLEHTNCRPWSVCS